MFQFTREFIVNDNEGKLTGGKKFYVDSTTKTLFVDNMINIRKKDVNAVYYHPYEAEVKEQVKVAIPYTAKTVSGTTVNEMNGVAAGDLVRLVITLGKKGQTTATFNDVYPDHSRHFFYEAIVRDSKAVSDVIDDLLAAAENEKKLWGSEKFMTLSKDGAKLVIDLPDCYTIVKEVRIVRVPVSDPQAHVGAVLTGYEDYTELVHWVRKEELKKSPLVDFIPADEGNGNTVQILKNMRLLTDAHLNPYGLQMDERPLPKGKYDQYMVELVTERRHIGHDVMGSVGTSLTTLVFYVLTDGVDKATTAPSAGSSASGDFYIALNTGLGCTPEKVAKLDGNLATEEAAPAPVHGKAKDVKANADAIATNHP